MNHEERYILTIHSEKGGVGKTTLATNLALYFRQLWPQRQVVLLSLDNHKTVDQMYRLPANQPLRRELGTVADLLSGAAPLEALLEEGLGGVSFVPSCGDSQRLRALCGDIDVLARRLVVSAPASGVLIIDTPPIFDTLAQNALLVADRVLVPVKDAPSMQNLSRLYQFLRQQGLPQKLAQVLPSMVEQRIRYNGPFKDPCELVRAFAAHRGYPCVRGFISKSPKVEALNTNPDGVPRPVLTHGRQTEVHLQLAALTRLVAQDARRGGERLTALREALGQQTERADELRRHRTRRLRAGCPVCGRGAAAHDSAFYAEGVSGAALVHADCLVDHVLTAFYSPESGRVLPDSMRQLLLESAERTGFLLEAAGPAAMLRRVDADGTEVSRHTRALRELGPSAVRLFDVLGSGRIALMLAPLPADGVLEPAFARQFAHMLAPWSAPEAVAAGAGR